jgi:hypothetical protein
MLRAATARTQGLALQLAFGLGLAMCAQAAVAQAVGSPFAVLKGRWVRPDGGYMIDIQQVGTDGRLQAAYANPRPLPFARAEAVLDGKTLKLFLELRAGGYNGSTYTLQYDPADDTLKGAYYQAVAREKYPVRFHRLPAQ